MPLILRRSADQYGDGPGKPRWGEDDYIVLSGGLVVGRIYRLTGGPQSDRWFWAISGVHAGPDVMETRGTVESLEEAKRKLAENFRQWIAWAKLEEARDQPEG